MGTIHSMLPRLTLNRQFVDELLAADAPCFGMGVVEERKSKYAFLALRPPDSIPSKISRGGFNFGHSVLGSSDFEVVHFGFEFYEFQTYNVLVNPNNELVQRVLSMMIDSGEYFFFAIDPTGKVTAFKSEMEDGNLTGIEAYADRIKWSTTTDSQYRKAVAAFVKNPRPPGILLNWVCRDNADYLDLTGDIISLDPA